MFVAMLCGIAPATPAAVERECLVTIQLRSGWATEQRKRVVFVSGFELTRMISVLKAEFHNNYALIFHGSGLPTVVRLDIQLIGVGREFIDADFLRLFEHINDQFATQIEGEGRELKWRLRARSGDAWVDPVMQFLSGAPR